MEVQRSSLMLFSEPIPRQTDVSLSLAKHVLSAEDTNFVFSPQSMHFALSMIANMSDECPTQDQVLRYCKSMCLHKLVVLHRHIMKFAEARTLGGPCLSFVNGLCVDRSHTVLLLPQHTSFMKNVYKGLCGWVDFQNEADEATKKINTWAEEKTSGHIKDLIPSGSVSSSTRLVLANALHFKGIWSEKLFDASITKDGIFFLSDGNSVQVPYMRSSDEEKKQYVRAFNDFKVLRLPYKHGDAKDERRFSMCFFLPDAKDGLPALLEKFGSISGFLQDHVPHERVAVGEIRIPKFKINSGFEASGVFEEQGEVSPDRVGISAIFHKSAIEVDEVGGEEVGPASEDSVSVGGCEEKLDFVAQQPFLFVVREDVSGVVFLVGQVVNPACC